MSKQSDPLKKTAPDLHRFYVSVRDEQQWYAVMSECRTWFGKNWRCQSHVRRRFKRDRIYQYPMSAANGSLWVWFDVPNPAWATWVSTKLGLQITQKKSV